LSDRLPATAGARSRARLGPFGALRAAGRRGLTVIELIVVIGIVVLVIGLGALGIASIRGADVSTTTNVLSGAMRYVYTLAVHHNRTYRLVIDMDNREFYTEYADSDDPCARYLPEGGAADPRAASEERPRTRVGREEDEEQAGPRYAEEVGELLRETFQPQTNVSAVMTEHHTEPQVSGRAAIYFYPTGRAERAMVWVGSAEDIGGQVIYESALTLELHALGRVTRYNRAVDHRDFARELQ